MSVVEFQGKEQELTDIIKTAYTTFKNSIGQGFGVSEQPNYTATRSHNLDVVLQLGAGSHSAAGRAAANAVRGTHQSPDSNTRPC